MKAFFSLLMFFSFGLEASEQDEKEMELNGEPSGIYEESGYFGFLIGVGLAGGDGYDSDVTFGLAPEIGFVFPVDGDSSFEAGLELQYVIKKYKENKGNELRFKESVLSPLVKVAYDYKLNRAVYARFSLASGPSVHNIDFEGDDGDGSESGVLGLSGYLGAGLSYSYFLNFSILGDLRYGFSRYSLSELKSGTTILAEDKAYKINSPELVIGIRKNF